MCGCSSARKRTIDVTVHGSEQLPIDKQEGDIMERKNAWEEYTEEEIRELEGLCKGYREFLDVEKQKENVSQELFLWQNKLDIKI